VNTRGVRTAFAHDAVVVLGPGVDARAPGAAITVAVCGSWDHPGPCPLAPHHTATSGDGSEVRLRVLFATEGGREAEVRGLIVGALSTGHGPTPEGGTASWRLLHHAVGAVDADEAHHAARLVASE
jgi:hypothetical protein